MHPDLAKMPEACSILRVSPNTVAAWAGAGRIKGSQIGATWYFWRPALHAAVMLPDTDEHPDSTPPVLNVPELAALIEMSSVNVRSLLSEGKVPGVKIGAHWRIPWAPIRDAIRDGHPLNVQDAPAS